MPCAPSIVIVLRGKGESIEPRLSGWLLEVALGVLLGEKGINNYYKSLGEI
jgi:hypothetical protein